MPANYGKVGIILDGGSFNGISAVGPLKAMAERGISPAYVQGISVGALNGAKLIENMSIADLEKVWAMVETWGPSFLFPRTDILLHAPRLGYPGLFTDRGLQELMRLLDIKKVVESPIRFDVAVHNESRNREHTLLSNHDPRFQQNPDLFRRAIIASASIPGFFPPVDIAGEKFSDGLRYDLESAITFGCDTIFVLGNDSSKKDAASFEHGWLQRILQPFNTAVEEYIELMFKDVHRQYPDYEFVDTKDQDPAPLSIRIARGVKSFFQSALRGDLPTFVPHRVIMVTVKILSPTLSRAYFAKGDFASTIFSGHEQMQKILDELEK